MPKIKPRIEVRNSTKVILLDELGKEVHGSVEDNKLIYFFCYFNGDSIYLKTMEDVKLLRSCIKEFIKYAKKNQIV